MTGANKSLGVFIEIDDCKKVRRKFPAPLFDGEILLMAAHHRDQNLVRQIEERRIESALNDVRKFVEIGDQFEQVGIAVDVERRALAIGSEFAFDLFAALVLADDDAVRTKLLFVVGEAAHLDLRLAEETVADRGIPRRQAAKSELQRPAVEHANEPTNRTNETRAIEARPGHGARPRQVVNHPRKNFEQKLVGRAAALGDLGGEVFALWGLHQVDRVQRHALALREADGSTRRCAGRIVGNGLGRAGDFALDVGLLGEQSANPGGKATRPAEGFNAHALVKVLGGEVALENGLKFTDRFGKHPGGDLLRADFKEQLDALVRFCRGLWCFAFGSWLPRRGHRATARWPHRLLVARPGGVKLQRSKRPSKNVGAPTLNVVSEGCFWSVEARLPLPDRSPRCATPTSAAIP